MRAVVFVSSVQNPEEKLVLEERRFCPVQETVIGNDFDGIALESAVRLKESGVFDEVVVFSAMPDNGPILKALAMGADRAVWCEADNGRLTPELVVETALGALEAEDDTVWFLGKLGVNFEMHVTAQRLAARLGVPCVSSVSAIECEGATFRLTCEDDAGTPVFEVKAPFVLTADLRLAEPRFPSLPNILRARRKPVVRVDLVGSETPSDGRAPMTHHLAWLDGASRACHFIDTEAFLERMSVVREGK